jgi:hypothetical protein
MPAAGRVGELTAEIADLQKRLERQVLALESEETTRRFAVRWPSGSRNSTRPSVSGESDSRSSPPNFPQSRPRPSTWQPCLARLPIVADRLHELLQGKLRAIFESLRPHRHVSSRLPRGRGRDRPAG